MAAPERRLGERAGEEGLAHAGGPADEDVARRANPVAGGEAAQEGAVEPAWPLQVEVLEAGVERSLAAFRLRSRRRLSQSVASRSTSRPRRSSKESSA